LGFSLSAWRDAQPSGPGSWNAYWFDRYDRAVSAAVEASQNIVLMIHGAPVWASDSDSANVPADPGDFATSAAFRRYARTRDRRGGVR
jgi:hypothetical protein